MKGGKELGCTGAACSHGESWRTECWVTLGQLGEEMVFRAVGKNGDIQSRVVALWNPGGEMGNVWYPWLQLDTGTSSMGVTDEGRAV